MDTQHLHTPRVGHLLPSNFKRLGNDHDASGEESCAVDQRPSKGD